MNHANEEQVFRKLIGYTAIQIQSEFTLSNEEICFQFTQKNNHEHYITVLKDIKDPFIAPVNADFVFQRPAGSNNYKILLDIGKSFVNAFGCTVNW